MKHYLLKLPYLTVKLLYSKGNLYKLEIGDKGKERLSLLKGGTIKECLKYIRSVYGGAVVEVKEYRNERN